MAYNRGDRKLAYITLFILFVLYAAKLSASELEEELRAVIDTKVSEITKEISSQKIGTVIFLMDDSGSMTMDDKINIKMAQYAIRSILTLLHDVKRYGLYIFKDEIFSQEVVGFKNADSYAQLVKVVDVLGTPKSEIRFEGAKTFLYSSIISAIEKIKTIDGKRALIVVTDGKADKEKRTIDDVIKLKRQLDFFDIVFVNKRENNINKKLKDFVEEFKNTKLIETNGIIRLTDSKKSAVLPSPFVFNGKMGILYSDKIGTQDSYFFIDKMDGINHNPLILTGRNGYDFKHVSVFSDKKALYLLLEEENISVVGEKEIINDNYISIRKIIDISNRSVWNENAIEIQSGFNAVLTSRDVGVFLSFWKDRHLVIQKYSPALELLHEEKTFRSLDNIYTPLKYGGFKESFSLYFYNDQNIYRQHIGSDFSYGFKEKSIALKLKEINEYSDFVIAPHPGLKCTAILRYEDNQLLFSILDDFIFEDFSIKKFNSNFAGEVDMIPFSKSGFIFTWTEKERGHNQIKYKFIDLANKSSIFDTLNINDLNVGAIEDEEIIFSHFTSQNPRLLIKGGKCFLFFSNNTNGHFNIYYKRIR